MAAAATNGDLETEVDESEISNSKIDEVSTEYEEVTLQRKLAHLSVVS